MPELVPPCPKCEHPLGLYYMECWTCYGNAGRFMYADYEYTEAVNKENGTSAVACQARHC